MKKRELIDYCRSKESDICNSCEYWEECEIFISTTGEIPAESSRKNYTDEEIRR